MIVDSISDSSNFRCSGDTASPGSANAKPVACASGIAINVPGGLVSSASGCETTMASEAALMTKPVSEPVADENQKSTRTGDRSLSHFLSTLNMSSLEDCMEGIVVLYHGRAYYEAFRETWPEFFSMPL
jgi:hypothetical protein